jgi:hypothetical protein
MMAALHRASVLTSIDVAVLGCTAERCHMVSNSAGDTVISMEGDADSFFMRVTTASESLLLDKSFLLLCGGSAIEGSTLSRHQFASAAAT